MCPICVDILYHAVDIFCWCDSDRLGCCAEIQTNFGTVYTVLYIGTVYTVLYFMIVRFQLSTYITGQHLIKVIINWRIY